MGPTRHPSGADRTQVGPMLAPWTLLSGHYSLDSYEVMKEIKCLKHDQNDGSPGTCSDHIIHAPHECVTIVTTMLNSSMITHGHSPEDFLEHRKMLTFPYKGSVKRNAWKYMTDILRWIRDSFRLTPVAAYFGLSHISRQQNNPTHNSVITTR